MFNLRRVYITTLCGVVLGIGDWVGGFPFLSLVAESLQDAYRGWPLGFAVILTRTVTGLGIGISAWQAKWWLHGGVMGAAFSLPLLPVLFGAGFSWIQTLGGVVVAGIVIGLVIEWVTTVRFGMEHGHSV